MKCNSCGAELREGAVFCPNCGNKFSQTNIQERQNGSLIKRRVIVLVVFLTVAVLGVIVSICHRASNNVSTKTSLNVGEVMAESSEDNNSVIDEVDVLVSNAEDEIDVDYGNLFCLKEDNLTPLYKAFLANNVSAVDNGKEVSFQNICDEFIQLSLNYDDYYPIERDYCQIEIKGIHYLIMHLYHPMGDAGLVVLSDGGNKLSVVGKSFIDDVDFPAVCSSGNISIYHGASDYLTESYYDITKSDGNCLEYPDIVVTSNLDCFIASEATQVHIIDEADYSDEYIDSLFEGGLGDVLPFYKYYLDDPIIEQYQQFLLGEIPAMDTDGASKYISEYQYQPDEVIAPGYCFIQSMYSDHPALVIEIPSADCRYNVIYSENGKLKVTESFGRESQSWSKLYDDTYMLYEYMYACGCTIVELRGLDENYVYSKLDTYPSENGYILPEDLNDHDENMHDEYLANYVDLTNKYGKRYSGAEEFLFDRYFIENRSNIIPMP